MNFTLSQDIMGFGIDSRNELRLLADVNGDTRKDIVGFGTHGVWVSIGPA